MGGVVPRRGDICKFGQCGSDHEQGRHCTPQGNSRPSHWGRRFELCLRSVNAGGVEGGIVPEKGDMEDPNAVEVDEEVSGGSFLEVGLEEHFAPINLAELHVPLGGREIDESFL